MSDMRASDNEIAQLREQAAQNTVPAKERRVYNIPRHLLVGIIKFQIAEGLPSETAAVKMLLEKALQIHTPDGETP